MNRFKQLIIFLMLLPLSNTVLAHQGIGYACDSYKTTNHYKDWTFKGCQKVIYNPDGRARGLEEDIIDIVYVNCFNRGPHDCENIPNKKQYPHYYGYSGWGGAPNPDALDFYDIYVLNDDKLPQGSQISTITTCLKDSEYGLESCRKIDY